jgi:hypothetical protein
LLLHAVQMGHDRGVPGCGVARVEHGTYVVY